MFELLMTWFITRKKLCINTCTVVLVLAGIPRAELDAEPVDKIDEESQNTAERELFLEHFHTVAWAPGNTAAAGQSCKYQIQFGEFCAKSLQIWSIYRPQVKSTVNRC